MRNKSRKSEKKSLFLKWSKVQGEVWIKLHELPNGVNDGPLSASMKHGSWPKSKSTEQRSRQTNELNRQFAILLTYPKVKPNPTHLLHRLVNKPKPRYPKSQ